MVSGGRHIPPPASFPPRSTRALSEDPWRVDTVSVR